MTNLKYYISGQDRNEHDKFYTHPWMTHALMRAMPHFGIQVAGDLIWEPCCGRGDISRVLQAHGARTYDSDIAPEPKYWASDELDLLEDLTWDLIPGDLNGTVTNTPYGHLANKCVQKVLTTPNGLRYAAFLLRTVWKAVDGRAQPVFISPPNGWRYAGEVVLTERPRWDWWEGAPPPKLDKHGKPVTPFHPYSWYVFSKDWDSQHGIQVFEGNQGETR